MLPASKECTNSDQFPMKGCHHLPLVYLRVRSVWNLLAAQEVRRGQKSQLHHWGLSFLLHHWGQEDPGPRKHPI